MRSPSLGRFNSNMQTDIVNFEAGSWRTALETLTAEAEDREYVEDTYRDALLEREAEYPTGLEIGPREYALAIPHANPEHVAQQSLLIGLPEEPVPFQSMDDPDEVVQTELVLLLIVKDEEGYNEFLSSLIPLFKQERFAGLVREGDGEQIRELILEECAI